MARFLIDEDLPRSLAQRLRASGVEARDVREVGLRGESDTAILKHAVDHGFALISADLGFSNLLQFPLGTHAGPRFDTHPPDAVRFAVGLRGCSHDHPPRAPGR